MSEAMIFSRSFGFSTVYRFLYFCTSFSRAKWESSVFTCSSIYSRKYGYWPMIVWRINLADFPRVWKVWIFWRITLSCDDQSCISELYVSIYSPTFSFGNHFLRNFIRISWLPFPRERKVRIHISIMRFSSYPNWSKISSIFWQFFFVRYSPIFFLDGAYREI